MSCFLCVFSLVNSQCLEGMVKPSDSQIEHLVIYDMINEVTARGAIIICVSDLHWSWPSMIFTLFAQAMEIQITFVSK